MPKANSQWKVASEAQEIPDWSAPRGGRSVDRRDDRRRRSRDRRSIIIIGEILVPSIATADLRVYQYRTVLRVPNRVGKLTLEAVHRGHVIELHHR